MRILVTGANRGLGYCLVKEALQRGHQVIAAHRRPQTPPALEWLAQSEDRLLVFTMDVTKETDVKAVCARIGELTGGLDAVINNAGVLFESREDRGDPITDANMQRLAETLMVNTVGPAVVMKYTMPYLYRSACPCLINISSEAGHLEPAGYIYPAYSTSKHALNMYTQKMRNYLAQDPQKSRVRVYMVHPGRMETEMGKEFAQISPETSAKGILDIAEGKISPVMDIPFIDYQGNPMEG